MIIAGDSVYWNQMVWNGKDGEKRMKVVIAADSFKGSCSAGNVAKAMAAGVREVFPQAETVCLPVADGGEGTTDALLAALGGQRVQVPAHDPLGRPITAAYGLLPDGTAVIETAAASGLPLLAEGERDALHASTYGTGELIRHALTHGATQILLGLGGSATTDGGLGLGQALGISYRDAEGGELGPGGIALAKLACVDAEKLLPEAKKCRFRLACDVRNTLCGPQGAAAVFGPQKGADPAQVEQLDAALAHYGEVLKEQLGSDAAARPGSGAAGGLACTLLAFLESTLCPGIDLVLDTVGFDAQLADCDLVLTGEGRLDGQSACGKVPFGVARRAKARGVPVIAIGGAIGPGAEALYGCGVDALVSAVDKVTTLADAMAHAEENITAATARTMRVLNIGREMR